MRKDVRLAIELAEESGVALPLSQHVKQLWQEAGWLADQDDFTRMADYRDRKEMA